MRPTATAVAVLALSTIAATAPAQSPSDRPEASPAAPTESEPVARPFGAGERVEVTCDEPGGYVFVAQGVVDDRPAYPDPFTKVGPLPVRLELPAGVYTVRVEGERFTAASTAFEVRHEPVHVRVHTGAQGLRDLSTLTLALGATALLAGGVLEVSGTGEGDSEKKHKITIPLFIAGGVGLASGLTLYFLSSSSIDHDGYVPREQAAQAPRFHTVGLSGHF